MEIEELLSGIIKANLKYRQPELDKIKIFQSDYNLNNLGMDSLDIMEVIMAAEHALQIKIPSDSIYDIYTFGDLCNLFKNTTKQ